MRHEWLQVLSDGIRLILIHATLLTLFTICVLLCELWSGFSGTCTSRVFHIVVTPFVRINQEWWMLEHQVSVIEQLVVVLLVVTPACRHHM